MFQVYVLFWESMCCMHGIVSDPDGTNRSMTILVIVELKSGCGLLLNYTLQNQMVQMDSPSMKVHASVLHVYHRDSLLDFQCLLW